MELQQTQNNPRVVLLYRASSKKQTDSENDIPLQRNILKPWIERQGWTFVKEFVEGGISGFKVSAANRDAIVEIRKMAERKEFDILAIYMSDRLGRIAEETPMVVSFLNKHGIKIISYQEGEISAHNHADKLMTYIRFWQAEGESLKTSARCTDAIEQMIKQGKWRGGPAPYGYKMVSRGTLNFKGRPIFDVEIDPETAEIVRTIFTMYASDNYGLKNIAHYLNDREVPTYHGALWDGSNIRNMLKNKVYIGIQEIGKVRRKDRPLQSPVMEHLRIIDDELFYKAEAVRLRKTTWATTPRGEARKTRRGTTLLSAIAYCGECGNKYTSIYTHNWKTENGERKYEHKNAYYRCRSFNTPKTGLVCGNTMHRVDLFDKVVNDDVRAFITELDKEKLLGAYKDELEKQFDDASGILRKITASIKQAERELEKLKAEVLKVIMGESQFKEEMLTQMIESKEAELIALQEKQTLKQDELDVLTQEMQRRKTIAEGLDTWIARYDALSTMDRKAMLLNIVDKITMFKDRVIIEYKLKLGDDDPRLTIQELPEYEEEPPQDDETNHGESNNGGFLSPFIAKRGTTHILV